MNKLTPIIIALMSFKGIGPNAVLNLLKEKNIYNYNYMELNKSKVRQIEQAIEKDLLTPHTWEIALQKAEDIMQDSKEKGIKIINFREGDYPQNFLSLKTFPILLYAKGNIELLNHDKSIAIIGTRNPSSFGSKMGFKISNLLSEKGYSIVSGLAKGIDTMAHKGAVDASGKTVAILAHGLDLPVYPKENRALAADILNAGGLLLSTYSNGTKLLPQYLAARDEWQSGLSDGVLVVETGIKGGTNITVGHAIKQKKPLAVLDHRQFKNGELSELKQAEGNMKYINENKAIPIYTEKSIETFGNEICSIKHEEEIRKLNMKEIKDSNKKEKTDDAVVEQINLL